MTTHQNDPHSIHPIIYALFDILWDRLIGNNKCDETPQQSAARNSDFATFYGIGSEQLD